LRTETLVDLGNETVESIGGVAHSPALYGRFKVKEALIEMACCGLTPILESIGDKWELSVYGPLGPFHWQSQELDEVINKGLDYTRKYAAYVLNAPTCHH